MKRIAVFRTRLTLLAAWAALWAGSTVAAELNMINDMVLDANALLMPANATYGRAINGVSFQTESLLTVGDYQYATWYHLGGNEDVYAGRRAISGTAWEVLDTGANMVNGDANAWDAHNVISMGVAGDGSLHLMWDMHGNTLRYIDTAAGAATSGAWNGSLFGAERNALNVGGSTLGGVTYPRFLTDPATGDMMLTYRTGGSGNGDMQFATRDDATGLWNAPHEIINGTDSTYVYTDAYGAPSDNRNAYLNGIDIDSTGRLHTTWTWREQATGSSNHDIAYAYSDDGGDTWRNNAGAVVGTAGNPVDYGSPGITVVPMDRGNTLMNQQTQAVDADGRVHAIMWHKTDEAAPVTGFTTAPAAYFHYMRDPVTGAWSRNELPTEREVGSRPDVAYDENGNLYVAYLSPSENDPGGYYTNGDLIIAAASKATGYADWQIVSTDTRDFAGEPFIDQRRLLNSGVVSVVIQENDANEPGATGTPLRVLEYNKLANLVVWVGDDAGTWSTSGGTDWDNDNDDVGDVQFANGFRATFDDGASSFNVNVATPVAPAASEFRNTVGHNYMLTGQGIGGSGGLQMTGGGAVTLANGTNTYTGDTTIDNGVLNLVGSASIAASPNINVAAGASLNASGAASGGLTLNIQTLAIAGQVAGNIEATNGSAVHVNAANAVLGNVVGSSNSLVTGAGSIAGSLQLQSGARLQVGGLGLPASMQPNITVIDDFSGDLSAYADTRILDAHGGTPNDYQWQVSGGALEIATSNYIGIEQAALTRTDVTLGVGQELLADYDHANLDSQDIGLYVGAGTPTPDVRADYVTIYVRNSGQVYSRGFDGSSEFNLVSGGSPGTLDSLFIARVDENTFELGYYSNGLRNIVATRDVGNTAIGDAIGFYSDVRNAGVRGQFDNLRIQGEDFLVAGETLLVDGDVTLSADTTLALDVFNPLIGDRLEVGGHLTAAGTIEVLLDAAAATPTLGDVFDVLDFASASGAFNAYQLPSLDAGLAWSVTDLLVTGELSVVTDVDLDNDGLVTGSDFLAIQRSNPALIAEWQRQLGNQLVAPTPARAQPVPEPTAAVICSLLASAVVALRQFIATR